MELDAPTSSVHRDAALMATQVRKGATAPIANMCPVPGAIMSFGLDGEVATARAQKHIYTRTLKLLSKSIVKLLAEKGIAADANIGDIDALWSREESHVMEADADVLVPSSSLGIFDPEDYEFVVETCNANTISPSNLKRLRELAEVTLSRITEHVASISAACHTDKHRMVNYVLDPDWAQKQNHEKLRLAAVTASGHGADAMYGQPSVMDPLGEYTAERLQRTIGKKLAQRLQDAGKTQKHWDAKTKTLLDDAGMVVSDLPTICFTTVFDGGTGGFRIDNVMCNFRATCFREVLAIPVFQTAISKDFVTFGDCDRKTAHTRLKQSCLSSKDKDGACFEDAEDWYHAVDRASKYETHLPELYKMVKSIWRIRQPEDKVLKKFTEGDYYDENMEWVVICDMYVLMISKKVRFMYKDLNNVIISHPVIIAAITKHVMNAIDAWPETQKFMRCVMQHIRPSFLTMPSHNLLKMVANRDAVRARAEWQNSGTYMKYIEHTHASLTAIDCLNSETHECFFSYNMNINKFLELIPTRKALIPPRDTADGMIDHRLTSLQRECKASFEDAMSFAWQCQDGNGHLKDWYHPSLKGLGMVHHVLRPILVSALRLVIDDLAVQAAASPPIEDALESNKLHTYASHVSSCNSELEKIVASRRVSSAYVVAFVKIVDCAHMVRQFILDKTQTCHEKINWPITDLISLILNNLPDVSNDNTKVLKLLETFSDIVPSIYDSYKQCFTPYQKPTSDKMAVFSARDNAVILLLSRCMIPFLANLPRDAVAQSKLPIAYLQSDLWETGPHQCSLKHLQCILNYREQVHGIPKEDVDHYIADHRSLMQAMADQNFANTMPDHIVDLNTKAFVTIFQTLYCAGTHTNGPHSIAPYREKRTSGFSPEYMESKQTYFRGQAFSYVGSLQAEVLKRRECNGSNCDPNDCGAIAAGYWRQHCCTKSVQEAGINTEVSRDSWDMMQSVIKSITSETFPTRQRSGVVNNWKKQQRTLGSDIVMTDDGVHMSPVPAFSFGGDNAALATKRLQELYFFHAAVTSTQFTTVCTKIDMLTYKELSAPEIQLMCTAELDVGRTNKSYNDWLQKWQNGKARASIKRAIGNAQHKELQTSYQKWNSAWACVDNFMTQCHHMPFAVSFMVFSTIHEFIELHKSFDNAGDLMADDVPGACLVLDHLVKCWIDLAERLYRNYYQFGQETIRTLPHTLDSRVTDVLPLFVTNTMSHIDNKQIYPYPLSHSAPNNACTIQTEGVLGMAQNKTKQQQNAQFVKLAVAVVEEKCKDQRELIESVFVYMLCYMFTCLNTQLTVLETEWDAMPAFPPPVAFGYSGTFDAAKKEVDADVYDKAEEITCHGGVPDNSKGKQDRAKTVAVGMVIAYAMGLLHSISKGVKELPKTDLAAALRSAISKFENASDKAAKVPTKALKLKALPKWLLILFFTHIPSCPTNYWELLRGKDSITNMVTDISRAYPAMTPKFHELYNDIFNNTTADCKCFGYKFKIQNKPLEDAFILEHANQLKKNEDKFKAVKLNQKHVNDLQNWMNSVKDAVTRTELVKTLANNATSTAQGPAQLVMGLTPTAKVTATGITDLATAVGYGTLQP